MKRIRGRIIFFFDSIDYPALGKSGLEVLFLTIVALFPLIINIIISSAVSNDILGSTKEKIIPGEILSYCLSFLAPSLYLLTKTHGSGYRLPLLHLFSIVTLLTYIATVILYLIAKNHWVSAINMEKHEFDLYFIWALIFLTTSIFFRVYAVYHGKKASSWLDSRNNQQNEFNEAFSESLK
jgi:hypothetical protein